MKKTDNPIVSRLDSLSTIDLECVISQVLDILKRAMIVGFISHDNKLFVKFEKSLSKKMETVVADTDDLSISDIFPIFESEISIGFYFDNQLNPEANPAKKFWFTVEELLAALFSTNKKGAA